MGKTFRKNPEFGGGTSASHVRRYRTHNRTKGSAVVNATTDEFRRGRNYKKSAVAWNPTPHGRRAPGRKGMPVAYAESAKARRQQQIARQERRWQFVEDDYEEERCDAACQEGLDAGPELNTQERAVFAEWYTPLTIRLGSDIFRMANTYTYTLVEDEAWTTHCLVRKIGDKFYVNEVDVLMDYPDLAYDDDLWIIHSIGIVLWRQSSAFNLPEDKNVSDIQGEFVEW